ncbi:hypothetical protein [Texcoconibacillus texcoconensis]|uniref:Uncharacterized protein n=1 Tax=Texcoconibacillus texcoconensis TaxID=1095777 RepID=A0A840QQN3_9BACI|nr:hypothetical protein [Texcoconibacillus texcoconensis]MBB5173648.1 hypothetical protein [Texcoconibacillus texcoconensis]
MKNIDRQCPECGGQLVIDAWETVNTNDDGTFHMESSLVYKCIQRCGYMKEVEDDDS